MSPSSYQTEPGSKRDKAACPTAFRTANLPSSSYPHGRKDNGKVVITDFGLFGISGVVREGR